MNPTAGSFNITPRMQRHFATFAVQMPSPDIVRSIYLQILDGHLTTGGFDADIAKLSAKLVDATIELHRLVRGGCWGGSVLVHTHALTASGLALFCLTDICLLAPETCVVMCGCLQVMHNFLPSAVKFHYQVSHKAVHASATVAWEGASRIGVVLTVACVHADCPAAV
jgi:hypothetical protein